MSVRGGSSGSGGTKIAGSGFNYFSEYAPTNLFVEKSFGFPASKITVVNDATETNDMTVSYDGVTVDGIVKWGETKDFYTTGRTSVFIKTTNGGTNIRLWAE